MSAYADRLLDYINSHPEFIEPESRKKEMINNFIIPGLQDLCISRSSFKWGIPVPVDPKHVIYDLARRAFKLHHGARIRPRKRGTARNIHEKLACRRPCDRQGYRTVPHDLLADLPHGAGLELPKKVICHPWFLFGTDKMSKSRGNVIYADELAKYLSVDGVRYYALAENAVCERRLHHLRIQR